MSGMVYKKPILILKGPCFEWESVQFEMKNVQSKEKMVYVLASHVISLNNIVVCGLRPDSSIIKPAGMLNLKGRQR